MKNRLILTGAVMVIFGIVATPVVLVSVKSEQVNAKIARRLDRMATNHPLYSEVIGLRLILLNQLKLHAVMARTKLIQSEILADAGNRKYLLNTWTTSVHFVDQNGKGFRFNENRVRYTTIMEKIRNKWLISYKMCLDDDLPKRKLVFDKGFTLDRTNRKLLDCLWLNEAILKESENKLIRPENHISAYLLDPAITSKDLFITLPRYDLPFSTIINSSRSRC